MENPAMIAIRPARLDPGPAARQSGDRHRRLERYRRAGPVVLARRGVPQVVRVLC